MKTSLSVLIAGIFTVTILSCSLTIEAQPKSKDFFGMNYCKSMVFIPGDESVAPFFISDNPVTNKEYILYLVWNTIVFGDDYPEIIFDALPGFNSTAKPDENFNPLADSASFKYYLDHSESFVSDYIFNPFYLNSAVIGISWEQANNYCHWLSDRYNEYSLIKDKILELDFDQQDENNFSTESFIFRQYEGYIRNVPIFLSEGIKYETGFRSIDYLLRPSFHLATKYELQYAISQFKLVDCFCASTKDADFLKPWYENFLPENKGYIYFNSPYGENYFWMNSENVSEEIKLPDKISEWCLDSYLSDEVKSVSGIYRSYGYDLVNLKDVEKSENLYLFPQKNKLGQMSVIITGENKNREFELINAPIHLKEKVAWENSYIFDHNTGTVVKRNGDIFTCFRVAVNAIKR